MKREELRPCEYRFPYSDFDTKYKGFFHGWATRDGNTYAIVETNSGLIVLVQTYDIKFLDV